VHRGDLLPKPLASRNPAALRRIANRGNKLFVKMILAGKG
jgi:hypothetical protein